MTTPQSEDTTSESTSSQTENSEHMIPKSRFNDVNGKLKDALARIEEMENAQAEQQAQAATKREAELAEQQRYKELYEQAKTELDSLKSVQAEAKRYKEGFEATLQARIASIPEEKRHLVPDFGDPLKTSAWLDKALPDLVTPGKPPAPKVDGGSGNTGGTNPLGQLNASQQAVMQIAEQMGYVIDSNRVAQFAKHPTQQTDLKKKDDTP